MLRRAVIMGCAAGLMLATFWAGGHSARVRQKPFASGVEGPPIAEAAVATPAPKPDVPSPGQGLRAPILLYHRIGIPRTNAPHKELWVSPAAFSEQMNAIAASGVAPITVDELYEAVRTHASFPEGVVVITFDDASIDQYDVAFPILRRLGLRATFYVPTARVGTPGSFTWEQIREMRKAKMSFGAHTFSHVDLTTLNDDLARFEIVAAKMDIEQEVGVGVTSFAYPFGKFSERIEKLVAEAGFKDALTTQGRMVEGMDHSLTWGRIEVHESNSGASLAELARRSGEWEPITQQQPIGGSHRVRHASRKQPASPAEAQAQPEQDCFLIIFNC